ncbi:MAG: glycosyltransferase family 39 protein [Acidobacteria bacterium]|nr:glycosyltransferase family 39 protein [Acidobacteriota bacterium]
MRSGSRMSGWLGAPGSWRLGAALVLAVLLAHLSMALWVVPALRASGFAYLEDKDAYLEIARSLRAGNGYALDPGPHPTLRRMPAYPLVLAGTLALTGGREDLAAAFQSLFAAGAAGLAFAVLRRRGALAAALAALATGLHPVTLVYATRFFSEGLSILCSALALYGVFRLAEGGRWGWWVFTGAALGTGWLTRSSLALWIVPLLLLALRFPDLRRPAWRWGAGVLALVAAVSPWVVRNHRVTGEFVPGSTWNARSALHGLRNVMDPAFPSTPREVDAAQIARANEAVAGVIGPVDSPAREVQEDRLASRWAREEVAARPLAHLAAIFPGLVRSLYLTSSKPVRLAAGVANGVLLALALAGLALRARRRGDAFPGVPEAALWALFTTFWLFHAAVFPLVRYLAPAVPALAILAGLAVSRLTGPARAGSGELPGSGSGRAG